MLKLQKKWPRESRQIKNRQGPRIEPWGTPAAEKDSRDLNEEKHDLSQTGLVRRNFEDTQSGEKKLQVIAATSASHLLCTTSFCLKSIVDGMCRPQRRGRKCVSLRSAEVTSGMLIVNHGLSCFIRYFSFQQFTEGRGNFLQVKCETSLKLDMMFVEAVRCSGVSRFPAVTFESSAHVLGIHTELW